LGLTAKIRDAKVALRQSAVSADYSNLGFVPLVHLGAQARLGSRWRLAADLDAAGVSQGRAEDFSLKLYYDPSPRWAIGAGYRMLEGGADVDDVYNFAWLHYGVASVTLRF